jgi:mRNA interferase YafQ
MRTIRFTARFKRDYKRQKSGRHGKTLDVALKAVVRLLAADAPLPRHPFHEKNLRAAYPSEVLFEQ